MTQLANNHKLTAGYKLNINVLKAVIRVGGRLMAGHLLEIWSERSLEECQARRLRPSGAEYLSRRRPASTQLWRYNHYASKAWWPTWHLLSLFHPCQRPHTPSHPPAPIIGLPHGQTWTTTRDTWPTCTPLTASSQPKAIPGGIRVPLASTTSVRFYWLCLCPASVLEGSQPSSLDPQSHEVSQSQKPGILKAVNTWAGLMQAYTWMGL